MWREPSTHPDSTGTANGLRKTILPPTSASREMLKRAGEQLLQEARGHVECGGRVGVRLFGARPDSALGKVGFKNGDRVDSLNGESIEMTLSFEKQQAWLNALLQVDTLTFELNRRGQDSMLSVSIEDMSRPAK